jgi:outer membrane lipoprotein SlyB
MEPERVPNFSTRSDYCVVPGTVLLLALALRSFACEYATLASTESCTASGAARGVRVRFGTIVRIIPHAVEPTAEAATTFGARLGPIVSRCSGNTL